MQSVGHVAAGPSGAFKAPKFSITTHTVTRRLLHPPPLDPAGASISCQARSSSREGSAPPLAVSIQEVEAQLTRLRPEPELPAWARVEAPTAKKKISGSTSMSRAKRKRLADLAAAPRAAALGLTPELCNAKIQELCLLLPEVKESELLSLEDGTIVNLMSDTALLATRLVELTAKIAPGTQHRCLPRLVYNSLSSLSSSQWENSVRSFLPVATLQGHSAGVACVAFTPDGRQALSGSQDGALKVWDLQTHACTATLQGHRGSVTAVAITPDGRHAVSGSWDTSLQVWDLQTLTRVTTAWEHKGRVAAVAISPDGLRAVSGGYDKTLRVWDLLDLPTGSGHTRLTGHQSTSVAITPDGRHAVTGSRDSHLRLWDLQSSSLVAEPIFPAAINAVAITPDGRHVLAGGAGKQLLVWDLHTRSTSGSLVGHTKAVRSVAVSPDGRHAVSGGDDSTVRLWDLQAQTCMATLREHAESVLAVAVSPDGRYALSGSKDRTLCMWDLQPHFGQAAAAATLSTAAGPP